jgi:hypothetical protein
MVKLFARSSGMAIANQLTLPPGAYAIGADRGQCCRVLYNYADRRRKKLIEKFNDLILVLYELSKSNNPKTMHMLHHGCTTFSKIPPSFPLIFG